MNTSKRSAQSIDALTGIRGIAAFWVATYHASGSVLSGLNLPAALSNVIGEGWLAVDLFFVLSGFIMCHVHVEDFGDRLAQPAWHFLKLRLVRIYPAHVVAALCWVPLIAVAVWRSPDSPSAGVAENFNPRTFIFAILLLNGWGFPRSQGWNLPSWSVGSEWFAYLCFPLLAKGMNRLKSAAIASFVASTIIAVCFVLAIAINHGRQYMLPEKFTLVRVTSEFAVGCCAYVLYSRIRAHLNYRWLATIALIGCLSLALTRHHRLADALYIPLFAALIVGLTDPRTLLSRALSSPILNYLGQISYSVYLIHGIVIVLFRQLLQYVAPANNAMWALVAVSYLAAVTIAGDLLHRLVETPARNFLRVHWASKGRTEHGLAR